MYCNNEISSIIDKLFIILSHPVNILKFSFFPLTQTFTESYSSATRIGWPCIDWKICSSVQFPSFGISFGIPFSVFMNQHNQRVKKIYSHPSKQRRSHIWCSKNLEMTKLIFTKILRNSDYMNSCKLETIMIIF